MRDDRTMDATTIALMVASTFVIGVIAVGVSIF